MQKIDFGQIKCYKCSKSLKDDLRGFYKCLHCSKEFKCTFYLCEDHKMTHKEDCGAEHKLIKYDEKYYFCSDHFTQYVSYCNTCNLNLCEMGEKAHKDKKHDVIKLESYDTKVKTSFCHIKDKSYCSESKNQEWIYNKTNKHIISKMDSNKCLDILGISLNSTQKKPIKPQLSFVDKIKKITINKKFLI